MNALFKTRVHQPLYPEKNMAEHQFLGNDSCCNRDLISFFNPLGFHLCALGSTSHISVG